MSVEDLKKFGKMCEEDSNVRAKAKEIGIDNVDGQIAYAKELGLVFTKQDMETLAKEVGITGKDELSEEDLEKVAGGVVTVTVGALVGGFAAAVSAAAAVGALGISVAQGVTKRW